jgi:hypothetical protein
MLTFKGLLIPVIVLTLVVLDGSPAGAQVSFGDGGTHTTSGPSGDVALTNNTTLQVVPGASILGRLNENGITGTINSSVVLSGGSVTGGPGALPGTSVPFGISLDGGSFTATGGTVTGGTYSFTGGIDGGSALNLTGTTTTISGGTFIAGTGSNPLTAVFALSFESGAPSNVSNQLTISGGTFIGASQADLNFGSATISGGTFEGSFGSNLSGFAQLNISGGTFDGGQQMKYESTGLGGSLNFFGSGFVFTPTFVTPFFVQGQLSGTLANGDLFNQIISFDDIQGYQIQSGPGEFSFIGDPSAVAPEPSSMLMVGLGLAIVGLVWMRSVRQSAPC